MKTLHLLKQTPLTHSGSLIPELNPIAPAHSHQEARFEDQRFTQTLMGIKGGGMGSSSAVANPLAAMKQIYQQGQPPQSSKLMMQAVEKHGLLPSLQQGTVYALVEKVKPHPIPRISMLAYAPLAATRFYQAMQILSGWGSWMPSFVESSSTQINQTTSVQYGRQKQAGISTEFEITVRKADLEGGHRIWWVNNENAKLKSRLSLKLAVNEGSQTFASLDDQRAGSLLAYQVHFVPKLPRLLVKTASGAIKKAALESLPKAIQAMVNHALDAQWTARSEHNPSGISYTLKTAD